MTTLTVTSVNSLLCQTSTCFRIGSKFRCIRSTPTEIQSISENDFECFARTGVSSQGLCGPSEADHRHKRCLLESACISRFRVRRGGKQNALPAQKGGPQCLWFAAAPLLPRL